MCAYTSYPRHTIGIFPFNIFSKPMRVRALSLSISQYTGTHSLTFALSSISPRLSVSIYLFISVCIAQRQRRRYLPRRAYTPEWVLECYISHRCHTINILMHECYAVVVHPFLIADILIRTVLEHRAYFIFHFKLLTHVPVFLARSRSLSPVSTKMMVLVLVLVVSEQESVCVSCVCVFVSFRYGPLHSFVTACSTQGIRIWSLFITIICV